MALETIINDAPVALYLGDDTAEAHRQAVAAAASAAAAALSENAALAAARYYSTIAAGVSATTTGQMFTSDEGGTWNYYLRTGTTPFYSLYRKVIGYNASGAVVLATGLRNAVISAPLAIETTDDPSDNARAAITFETTAGGSSSDSRIVFSTNLYGVRSGEAANIDKYGNLNAGVTTGWTGGYERIAAKVSGAGGRAVSGWNAGSTGSAFLGRVDNAAAALHSFYYGASTIVGSITTNGTTTSYNTTSDSRLKENVEPAGASGALVDAIEIVQFDWISDQSHQRFGVIAQDLLAVFPEAVHAPADEEQMMAVDYSKLVPLLVAEVQALRARVAALEAA